jgi:seryl-tRNA synthetase
MLDIKFIRENPEVVKENIKKKFQEQKLPLVDEVIALDSENRAVMAEAQELRSSRNTLSKQVGMLMGQAKKDPSKLAEAEAAKAKVKANADRLSELEAKEGELAQKIRKIMLQIPNIIDPSVPIGPDDSCNVEVHRFGEPVVPDFEIPYHTQIMESFNGIDMDAAGRVSGNGFYYLMGDIARIHEGVLAYARDFMIGKGFCIPPFMIHGNVVEGVMSQTEMDAMMYKIEGEDLYLIGTSEHSMIGKFIDQIIPEDSLPQTLTSYSPCFRKEKGAHGIEERGIYRIHQFEKQEMIVVCKPEDSMKWYEQMWRYSVELFRSLDIPVRQLECCSGDLADLKVKSCDIEAWSPRQKKYFEVCSCSNLGDAQARRLKMRVKGSDGKMYLPHTLNNTVVAPPRMLIAFLENNLQADGSVKIPAALRPYLGGMEVLVPKK